MPRSPCAGCARSGSGSSARPPARSPSLSGWPAGRKLRTCRARCSPAPPGAPGRELWRRDFTGGCGLFSFVLSGGDPAARARFIDALELFGIGFSWGGYESLVIPFDAGRVRSATAWPPAGWNPQDRLGVRLSIGLEDPGDLMNDLERGFAAMSAQ